MASDRNDNRRTRKLDSLRGTHQRLTRQLLVDAAIDVLSTQGYSAPVEAITQEIGASRATFYLHFQSKADLVRELLDTDLLPSGVALYAKFGQLRDPSLADVREWVALMTEWIDEHARSLAIVRQAATDDPEIQATVVEATHETWRAIRPAFATSGLSEETAQHRAVLVHLQTVALADIFRIMPDSVDREALLDALADDLWWAFRRPAPTSTA
jgi:AcrR family transcriptional regulator